MKSAALEYPHLCSVLDHYGAPTTYRLDEPYMGVVSSHLIVGSRTAPVLTLRLTRFEKGLIVTFLAKSTSKTHGDDSPWRLWSIFVRQALGTPKPRGKKVVA